MPRRSSHNFPTYISPALSFFGLQGTTGVAIAVSLLGSFLLSWVLIMSNGSVVTGAGFVIVLTVVLVTIYRLDWGLYIFLSAIFLSDNFAIPGYDPWTARLGYLITINSIRPGLAVGYLTPMEIHLLFLISVWILMIVVNKNLRLRPILAAVPTTLFFLWLLASTIYGTSTGGDTLKAIWQIRSFLYLGILCVFVPQIITTKKQIRNILWVIIGSLSYKAGQAAMRYIDLGYSLGEHRALASHEDPVLFVTVFLFLFCLIFLGGSSSQRGALLCLLLPLLLGFYAANRRAAYICLLICLLVLAVVVPDKVKARVLGILTAGGILFGAYLAVYWNDEYGARAQFAQAVKSAVTKDPKEMRREDYYSGLARDQENYNLAVTLRRLPLGLGFGKQHDWAIMNFGFFSLRGYATHNAVLWLLVTSGPIGFFLFFYFMNSVLFNGSMILFRLRDPYLMAVCTMCIIAIPNHIVHTYVDMGFTRARSMAYLGLLIALISVINRADYEETGPVKVGSIPR
jgi:hypothetical protein